jgi:hypothetical protein
MLKYKSVKINHLQRNFCKYYAQFWQAIVPSRKIQNGNQSQPYSGGKNFAPSLSKGKLLLHQQHLGKRFFEEPVMKTWGGILYGWYQRPRK